MAVRLLHGGADRRADVREDERRVDVRREIAQVAVVPGGLDAAVHAGRVAAPYQPTPKPSPFVVSAPSFEWRLWWISECSGL